MDIVQKIKDRADIVDVVSDHVVLKRSGANYLGLCPFHKDSKPSMHVSPSKGIFKCFSCGAGGDIFTFWSEYHKKSFKESIKDLAQKFGIEMVYSEQDKQQAAEANKNINMHELAAKYYTEKLLASGRAEHCRKYLEQRDISTSSIENFQLGYAPNEKDNWNKLIDHIKHEMKVSEAEICEAGLATQKKDGSGYFDRFRGRLMIPIHDERGRVIAFGARALKDPETGKEPEPKYLNSPETPIYHKGDNLYATHLAKEHIRKEDGVVVVEGYFDVITLHQAGIKNVVANQGTALTAQQARLLTKFSDSKRIFICFDTDKAGEQATERGVEVIMQATAGADPELRIMRVPSGKDPDDLVKTEGTGPFLELIKNAPLLINYELDKISKNTEINNPREKAQAVKKVAKLVSYVKNKVERAEYIHIAAEKLRANEDAFHFEIEKELKVLNRQSQANPYARQDRNTEDNKSDFVSKNKSPVRQINGHLIYVEDAVANTEREILVITICHREILEDFLGSGRVLISDAHQKILEALTDISFENPDISDPQIKYQMLSDKLTQNPEFSSHLADIAISLDKEENKPSAKTRFADSLKTLDRHSLNYKMKEVISKIKEIESSSDFEAKESLWVELQKEKRELVSQLQSH